MEVGSNTSWTCEPFIQQEMSNEENVPIFTRRACMAEIYLNGGFQKQNKWSMIVPIKVCYSPGPLTEK